MANNEETAGFLLNVLQSPCQDLAIQVRGGWGPADDEDEDEGEDGAPADPVRLFLDCANLGMFCGLTLLPRTCRATLLSETRKGEQGRTWSVRLENVDPRACRILFNLLRARGPASVRIRALDSQPLAGAERRPLGPRPLFPERFVAVPFPVDVEAPGQTTCPRTVQIQFTQPPPPERVEEALAALARWALLPALGGFAQEDQAPEDSVTEPDLAFLLDPVTLEQGFDEIFDCDEAAFDAIINWAVGFHQRCPIAGLVIR